MNVLPSLSVDLHVLISAQTYRPWVRQCLDSIEAAIARAPFAVQLFTVRGVVGHIGQGRHTAYQLGTSPYVTYVDDDDFLLPHAFEAIASALIQWPDAVFPAEQVLLNGCPFEGQQRHHLPIYKRSHIIDHRPYVCAGDVAQIEFVKHLHVIDVLDPVYVHRLYSASKARQLRLQHPGELGRCLAYPAAVPLLNAETPRV